jgi:hypothetical protein
MLKPHQQTFAVVILLILCFTSLLVIGLKSLEDVSAKSTSQKMNTITNKKVKPTSTPQVQSSALYTLPNSADIKLSYWIYPGEPACGVVLELQTLGKIDELKPEYATISEDGSTKILTDIIAGCNAFSPANNTLYKSSSDTQFATVSGSGVGFSAMVNSPEKRTASVQALTKLAIEAGITGIELDFEGFGGWTDTDYIGYLAYVKELGNSLHTQNKKLMIDAPAIYNSSIQKSFKFKYKDLDTLPVDYITIMAYDYQYDYGTGSAVTDDTFLKESIRFAKSEIPDYKNKIQVGLPTYGYTGLDGSYRIDIKTREQIFKILSETQRNKATRIPNSSELIYKESGKVFVWQDSLSIQHKVDIVNSEGINKIAFWHLGGNQLVQKQ